MSAALPMTPRPLVALVVLAVMVATLPACTGVRKSLGWDKNPPDEFKIVSRAPLAVPEEFTLPPPELGKLRPQELQPQQEAQAALFGMPLDAGSGQQFSTGEESILMTAEVEDQAADIRDTVDQEYAQLQVEGTWIDDLIWWKKEEDPTAIVIDPVKEQERLQNNAALGLPANEGDFEGVIIQPREKAILEGIF